MDKQIVYADHLLFRLKIRNIPEKLPEHVYRDADRWYYDRLTELSVAVKDIRGQIFMVAFQEKNDMIRLITIHPLKKNQELNRVKSGRWQRIKRTS